MTRLIGPKLILISLLANGCDRSSDMSAPPPAPTSKGDSWIRGDVDQRFAMVAKHLRGFDVAMMETGYRYGELYWAGQDRSLTMNRRLIALVTSRAPAATFAMLLGSAFLVLVGAGPISVDRRLVARSGT